MIRILHFGMVYNTGGVQTFLMNYYRNIDRNAIQFDFVNIYNKDFYYQKEIEAMGGKIYKVSNYRRHPFQFMKEVVKIINENCYEVIHCNMSSAVFLWPLLAAKKSNAKVIIVHGHNAKSDKGNIKEILHRMNKNKVLKYANYYFSCSDVATKWFYPKSVLTNNNYYKINNAIDVEKFQYNSEFREKIRNALHCDSETLIIGHVGRFATVKNHDFLIDVFTEVLKLQENAKLVLIGNGELEEAIKNKVKRLGVEQHVNFIGSINNVNEYMQAFDVFVLPSINEAFPFVAIEAQSSGVSCIFSKGVATESKINENVVFLPLSEGPVYWAQKIVNHMHNTKREDAYKHVTQKGYNIKIEAKHLQLLYEQFLK